jgi:hypothetical protein
MPDDLQTVIARVKAHATANLQDSSVLLTTSLHRIYGMAKETGSVAGCEVIHVGPKNLRLSSRQLLRVCGLLDDDDAEDGAS